MWLINFKYNVFKITYDTPNTQISYGSSTSSSLEPEQKAASIDTLSKSFHGFAYYVINTKLGTATNDRDTHDAITCQPSEFQMQRFN